MFPHVVSHIIEQISRLILTVIFIPRLINYNLVYAVTFLVLINLVSEFISIIVILMFMPKNIVIHKEDIIPTKRSIKSILDISIPNTSTRVIGNIGYFLEPVVLTAGMIASGYSISYITMEYGIVSGYSMPMLLLPGFFTGAISSSLIPVVSKAYVNNNYKYIKKKIKQALILSLSIGIPSTIILFLFPNFFLKLLYGINVGGNYMKALSFPFLLYYIELPLSAILQALNKAKEVMYDNILGIVIKTILLYLTSLLHIGIYSFIIACSINIIIVTTMHFIHIKKVF